MATLPKMSSQKNEKKPAPCVPNAINHQASSISVSQAKTHLLAIVTDIEAGKKTLTITRRGRPVAQIIPIASPEPASALGCMKGTFTITGDIVSPDHESWGPASAWGTHS